MIEDNPRMEELTQLIRYCRLKKEIYIYGHDLTQKMISKYLWMSQVKIAGFIVLEKRENECQNEPFPVLSLVEAKNRKWKIGTGIIIAEPDSKLNDVMDYFSLIHIHSFYIVSDWNRRTIVKKMQPRELIDFYLEVNLADHCNLNCQCCDHFSPIACKTFLDYDQYVKDIKRLASFTDGKIGLLKLQGGEPLLNERVVDFMKVSREVFPDSHICMFTDGLLLPKLGSYEDDRNIWKAIKKYEIEVRMTQYPIPINIDKIVNQAKAYDVPVTFDPPKFEKGARLWIFSEIGALKYRGDKHSVKHPFDLSGKQDKYRFISCYQFNESIVLRDGKIYTCPMIPYSHFFNEQFGQNLEVKDDCYIDIYKAQSFYEISEFCTRRTSFCDYCAVHKRSVRTWKQSEHDMEEWTLN